MNCPNCNSSSVSMLNENSGFAKGTRECTTCQTVFTKERKVLREGKSVLNEVMPKSTYW